jgi:hypothetical protein
LLFSIDRNLCLFCALALPRSSISHLASLSPAFASGSSSVCFLLFVMAHIKSTAHPVGAATGSSDEGHESEGSTERIESAPLSDTGSHSGAGDDVNEGSHTQSYYFGPSTMAVSRVRGMIDHDYFAEGMGRKLEEETIPEPNADEAVVFEEFFTTGLRMPHTLCLLTSY